MGKNRVPKTVTFCIEAVKEVLKGAECSVDLAGAWQHYDWTCSSPDTGFYDSVDLEIRLHGVPNVLVALCNVPFRDRADVATVRLFFDKSSELSGDYICNLEGNRITVRYKQTVNPGSPVYWSYGRYGCQPPTQ